MKPRQPVEGQGAKSREMSDRVVHALGIPGAFFRQEREIYEKILYVGVRD